MSESVDEPADDRARAASGADARAAAERAALDAAPATQRVHGRDHDAAARRTPRRVSRTRLALASLVLVGLALLVLEYALERNGYGVPIEQVRLGKLLIGGKTAGLVEFDRRLVFRLNPHWRLNEQHAGPQALGAWPWRGRPAEPAPSSMQRIVCVGDSNMYGYGLRVRETLPEQLAQRLAERGFDPCAWQCLSYAVPAWSSVQLHNGLDDALELGNVRAAVVWLTPYNDLTYAIGRTDVEIDRVNEHPTLLERCTESALGDALARVLHPSDYAPLDMQPIVDGWERGEPLYGTRVSADESVEELRGMLAAARARGVHLIVLAPPYRASVLERNPGVADLLARLIALARAEHAPVVEADGVLAASGLDVRHLWLDELHPSVLGQAQLAAAIAQVLAHELESEREGKIELDDDAPGAQQTSASSSDAGSVPTRARGASLAIERVEPRSAPALGDTRLRIELTGWSRGDALPVVTVAGAPLLDLAAVGEHALEGTLIENGSGAADVIVQTSSACACAPNALVLRAPEWRELAPDGSHVRLLGRAGDRYQVFASAHALGAPLWTEYGAVWIDATSVLGKSIEGVLDASGEVELDLGEFAATARARALTSFALQGRCIPHGLAGEAAMFLSEPLTVPLAP